MCLNNWGRHSEWILLIILVVILCSCQSRDGCCHKGC